MTRKCHEVVLFKIASKASQSFPRVDLWLCRDVLFHLSYQDILGALEQFAESDIPYLLTNTHKNDGAKFVNGDILTGHFSLIDLFQAPFYFSPAVLYKFDDYVAPQPVRGDVSLFKRAGFRDVASIWV